MEDHFLRFYSFLRFISGLTAEQIFLLSLSAITWLAGGNILIAFHYKRVGKHWASGFKPFAFPFRDFNAKEWAILAGLFVFTLVFGYVFTFWK